jgi:hypothetical protein
METQSVRKTQARQTRPTATPRAFRPTCHTAATKVWTARNWLGVYQRVPDAKTPGEETYESDQGDPQLTKLLDKALCCAIVPCRDDPVVSPPGPDIKNTTNCLKKVEHEK